MAESCDIAVLGAGAAGLMAAVHAARAGPHLRVVLLDGAARLGAKILISGGGRCNVTHDRVDERSYAGGSPKAIRKVLRRFDVPATLAFFESRGVSFAREDTGKLFPTTNRARTVLDALLGAASEAGVRLRHPFRVEEVRTRDGAFVVEGTEGSILAQRVVLATGGKSVPRTGSDGHGYEIAKRLGHELTTHVVPALVPLLLPPGHPLTELRGITSAVVLEVRSGGRRRLARVEGAMLLTHFGLSGPCVLDASRHWILAHEEDPGVTLTVTWLPEETRESLDAKLSALGRTGVLAWLRERLSARLASTLLGAAGIPEGTTGDRLRREERRRLVGTLLEHPLPVTGPRGWAYAEATAGGVPLTEVRLETMESRRRPGLHFCGEILDVDGRIGGYNFQWAWASGFVAGVSATGLLESPPPDSPEDVKKP